jgi:8-oxo-dGTP diphosphatase
MDNKDDFSKYPTGKIPKGSFCEFCKRYNSRSITCDIIAVKENKIILIKRNLQPEKGKWALPGGYLDWDETAEECAKRELKEETGYNSEVEFFTVISDPKRDSGKQNVAIVFSAKLFEKETVFDKNNEVSELKWFDLDKLPKKLAFDHKKIINKHKKYLNKKN